MIGVAAVEFRCGSCGRVNRLAFERVVRMAGAPSCGACGETLLRAYDDDLGAVDPAAYRHPLDTQALARVDGVPGVRQVLRAAVRATVELDVRLTYAAQGIEVGPRQLPRAHEAFVYAAARLGIDPPPALFAVHAAGADAGVFGLDRNVVVVTTGALELFDGDELVAFFARELGHVHAGHMLYKTAARFVGELGSHLGRLTLGLGRVVTLPLKLAFAGWERCAALTADRAALLVVRRPEVVLRTLLMEAGGSPALARELDLDAFLEQARALDEMRLESTWSRAVAAARTAFQARPYPVYRARELLEWVANGTFLEILDGEHRLSQEGSTCPHCGRAVPDGVDLCPSCGADIGPGCAEAG